MGLPLLVLPCSTDQFTIAADLERRRLGRALDPNRAAVGAIRDAAVALLGPSYRSASASLGRSLRADPGPTRARRAVLGLA